MMTGPAASSSSLTGIISVAFLLRHPEDERTKLLKLLSRQKRLLLMASRRPEVDGYVGIKDLSKP
jgi:hypothetical protein